MINGFPEPGKSFAEERPSGRPTQGHFYALFMQPRVHFSRSCHGPSYTDRIKQRGGKTMDLVWSGLLLAFFLLTLALADGCDRISGRK
jgi:hypothetical protein